MIIKIRLVHTGKKYFDNENIDAQADDKDGAKEEGDGGFGDGKLEESNFKEASRLPAAALSKDGSLLTGG